MPSRCSITIETGVWTLYWQAPASWSIDGDGILEFSWVERDGPPPDPSAEQGVGLGLVRGLIEYELGGEVQIEFASQGMRCRLRVPVA